MPGERCILSDVVTDRGYHTLILENGRIAVTVLPDRGAEILSLVDKTRGIDLLWKSPWGRRRPPLFTEPAAGNSATVWLENYAGGWQEIFPNGGDACVYKGAPLNFHGEASILAWDYSVRAATSSRVVVELWVRLRRSPFLLRRIMTVERLLPAVLFEETITNEGCEPMHFMWGHHPAYGRPFLSEHCRIQAPAKTYRVHANNPSARFGSGAAFAWPKALDTKGHDVDLRVLPPAGERVAELGYLCDLDEGWYSVANTELGFGIALAWSKEVLPYIWHWQEFGGTTGYPWYGQAHVLALEPFSSMPGSGLACAIEAGTAPTIAPGASLSLQLAAVITEGVREITSVSADARVKFASRLGKPGKFEKAGNRSPADATNGAVSGLENASSLEMHGPLNLPGSQPASEATEFKEETKWTATNV